MSPDTEVLVVGGGPVGLMLALRLGQCGVGCQVLERQERPAENSRAIGIHPPSLERFERLGLAESLLERGVQVRRGRAVGKGGQLGVLDFSLLGGRFPFPLSCPQDATEALLADAVAERMDGVLQRGAEVVGLQQDAAGVTAQVRSNGTTHALSARYLVACDGKQSFVRQSLGISVSGGAYEQTFVMGDFADDTDYASDAVLFMSATGLVESFPLPRSTRRWVASTSSYVREGVEARVRALVTERTGHGLHRADCHWHSAFGVQRLLAERFWQGRVLLAGDAAHVVSPIGGQGMNLGWGDAWALGEALQQVLHQGADPAKVLGDYERRRRRSAAQGILRAQLNMTLGVGGWWNPLRDLTVRVLLRSPVQRQLAQLFTMRGL